MVAPFPDSACPLTYLYLDYEYLHIVSIFSPMEKQ